MKITAEFVSVFEKNYQQIFSAAVLKFPEGAAASTGMRARYKIYKLVYYIKRQYNIREGKYVFCHIRISRRRKKKTKISVAQRCFCLPFLDENMSNLCHIGFFSRETVGGEEQFINVYTIDMHALLYF